MCRAGKKPEAVTVRLPLRELTLTLIFLPLSDPSEHVCVDKEHQDFLQKPEANWEAHRQAATGPASRVSPYRQGVLYPECRWPALPRLAQQSSLLPVPPCLLVVLSSLSWVNHHQHHPLLKLGITLREQTRFCITIGAE